MEVWCKVMSKALNTIFTWKHMDYLCIHHTPMVWFRLLHKGPYLKAVDCGWTSGSAEWNFFQFVESDNCYFFDDFDEDETMGTMYTCGVGQPSSIFQKSVSKHPHCHIRKWMNLGFTTFPLGQHMHSTPTLGRGDGLSRNPAMPLLGFDYLPTRSQGCFLDFLLIGSREPCAVMSVMPLTTRPQWLVCRVNLSVKSSRCLKVHHYIFMLKQMTEKWRLFMLKQMTGKWRLFSCLLIPIKISLTLHCVKTTKNVTEETKTTKER
jgi:hypothetical protein